MNNGLCECGCGLQTKPWLRTNKRNGIKRGDPQRFVFGHGKKKESNRCLGIGRTKNDAGYVFKQEPDHPRASSWGYVREHILIAEEVLGKPLPEKAVVHHHTPEQLVICQDQAYHMLIHLRTRAFEACGHANYRKCQFCQTWDDPQNMYVSRNKKQACHRLCRNKYYKDRYQSKAATGRVGNVRRITRLAELIKGE